MNCKDSDLDIDNIAEFKRIIKEIANCIIRNTDIKYEINCPHACDLPIYAEIKFIAPFSLDLSNLPHVNPLPKIIFIGYGKIEKNLKITKVCVKIISDMNYAPSNYWNSILSLFIIHCIANGMQYEKGKDVEIILRSSLINYRIDNPEATTFTISYIDFKTQEEKIITPSMNIVEYLCADELSTYQYFKYSDCMQKYLYRQNDENKPTIPPIVY